MSGTYYADLAYAWALDGNIEISRKQLMRIVEESRRNAERADELELWKARSLRARKAAKKRKEAASVICPTCGGNVLTPRYGCRAALHGFQPHGTGSAS